MKSNLIDIAIALFALILLSLFFTIVPTNTPSVPFSPPFTGAGRESCTDYQALSGCVPAVEIPSANALSVAVSDSGTRTVGSGAVSNTETFVETIPPIEGKYLDVPMSAELQDYVRSVSAEYGIPFELTMAVIYVESRFNPGAISDTADYGLMQISTVNHAQLASDLGITDFLDAKQSIRAGCHILADKIQKSGGDFTTALLRYHDGDGGALDLMAQGIFSTEYTDKVLTKYYEYIREG